MDDHTKILEELEARIKPLLDNSPDGIYFWLDETNMICNEKLASIFGYTIKEILSKTPFLENLIAEDYREVFSLNYHHHVANLSFPVTFRFNGINKSGKEFPAETDMIPFSWKNHAIAFHFVRKISAAQQT
ncbi:PAS domain S-box protein [Candidatus Pacearchaeota archaeon]|nr:PAS domain S-box protein [Candidatus Pacearchaeota archaeon]